MATETTEIRRSNKKQRDRENRMYWFYVGYIMALEENGLDKTEDAIQKKKDANNYGHCYEV